LDDLEDISKSSKKKSSKKSKKKNSSDDDDENDEDYEEFEMNMGGNNMGGFDPLQFIFMNMGGFNNNMGNMGNMGGFNNMGNMGNMNNNNKYSKNAEDVKSELCREHKRKDGKIIQVRKGDLTEEDADVIVNAANQRLDHASGLAGAIIKAGGEIIQDESDIYFAEHGKVPEGDIATTGAGKLPCKHIIHAVGPIWHGGIEGEADKLRSAIKKSLLKANELKYKSIAFPAIGTGIFNYPREHCAKSMFDTAIAFCAEFPQSSVREIRFTNFDDTTVDCFIKEFKKRFPS